MEKSFKIIWRGCGDYGDRAYMETFFAGGDPGRTGA